MIDVCEAHTVMWRHPEDVAGNQAGATLRFYNQQIDVIGIRLTGAHWWISSEACSTPPDKEIKLTKARTTPVVVKMDITLVASDKEAAKH